MHMDGTTHAVGVVVVATDTAGAEVARALSGTNGTFFLTVPAPARYVVKALRIGYRPTVLPPLDVADGDARTLRIVLSGEAVMLETVRVEGATTCRIAEEAGRLVANAWDQAHTALAASTVASGGRPFIATLATYSHYTPRGQEFVQAESVTVVKQSTTSGFVSVPAESLAANGYFTQRGYRYAYHAPDANVLLSPTFAATHCFRVVPGGTAHFDWIGIGFRPAEGRRGLAEVDGTLWLDRASSELRRLEFRYVNLPRSSGGEAADGWVDFVRLLTGDWIIKRWAIRTPVTEERTGAGVATRYVTIARRVVGGVTRGVERDGIIVFNDPGASLTLALRAGDDVNRIDDTHVVLFGTQHEGHADHNATVALGGLNAGRFRALVWTTFMTWLGTKPLEYEVDVAPDSANLAELTIPTADEVAVRHCKASGRPGARLFYGTVRQATGDPVPHARVLFQNVRAAGFVSTLADEYGQWKVCTFMPAGSVASSVVVEGKTLTRRTISIADGPRLLRIDLAIP